MSMERTQMRMKLTQEQYDLKRTKREADALRDAVRAELKPASLCEIEDLDLDRALDILIDLRAKWRVVKALIKNIARLEDELEISHE